MHVLSSTLWLLSRGSAWIWQNCGQIGISYLFCSWLCSFSGRGSEREFCFPIIASPSKNLLSTVWAHWSQNFKCKNGHPSCLILKKTTPKYACPSPQQTLHHSTLPFVQNFQKNPSFVIVLKSILWNCLECTYAKYCYSGEGEQSMLILLQWLLTLWDLMHGSLDSGMALTCTVLYVLPKLCMCIMCQCTCPCA